ncbi:MAG TPA: polyketide synthase, partial [Polyangium sp.]|nr:polyketide synthase [Polyangium sp.]
MTTKRVDVSGPGFSDDDSPPASNLSSMQRAIVTIQKMRTKLEALERARTEPIAIVGMACRIPGGANTPESFFKLLEDGVDTISEIPADRWRVEQEGANSEGDTRALRWGSFLTNVDRFDAAFFGISPREAESMDPQHRLLLEVTWEALERAGQLPERLMGTKTGVFVGIWAPDYQLRVLTRDPNDLDAYCFTGTVLSTAAGRLSYILGVQGPCMAIDTACSSSLTAIHLACQSLRSGESTMAIAGGVNLMLAPSTTHLLSKTQALSPDGRCKTFDARANGYVRGEGCGMLVLKRLSDAERDGDSILALIRGSAVNQDGRSTGLTAPNVLSQQALLRQALESARLSPQDIAYLETHGTGTSLGDPIEVEAIKAVFGAPRDRGAKCVLGALKSNIGHLEAAAGVAGLIKAVLA